MSHEIATTLQDLSGSGEYYSKYNLYSRLSSYQSDLIEWLDVKAPVNLAESFTGIIQEDGALRVLCLGPGDGRIDHKILTLLQKSRGHLKIHAVIIEPDAASIQHYQDLVTKESTKLQGIDFDWRCQTFQEYLTTTQGTRKFHFISSVSSIFYLGKLDECLKNLYDRLYEGGVLFMTMSPGENGWGRMYRYLQKKLNGGAVYCTTADVQDVCGKQNIPISEIQLVETFLDISACFEPQLSENGDALLDFLTQKVNFNQNAPAELRDAFLQFLWNDCTERGAAGEVILDESTAVVIIRRQ